MALNFSSVASPYEITAFLQSMVHTSQLLSRYLWSTSEAKWRDSCWPPSCLAHSPWWSSMAPRTLTSSLRPSQLYLITWPQLWFPTMYSSQTMYWLTPLTELNTQAWGQEQQVLRRTIGLDRPVTQEVLVSELPTPSSTRGVITGKSSLISDQCQQTGQHHHPHEENFCIDSENTKCKQYLGI